MFICCSVVCFLHFLLPINSTVLCVNTDSLTSKNFMSQAPSTPTHMGQRVSDNHQVSIPAYLGPCNNFHSLHAFRGEVEENVEEETRRSGLSTLDALRALKGKAEAARAKTDEHPVDDTPPLWLPVTSSSSSASSLSASTVETRLEEFMARAEAVVSELKTEKLRRYYESEAKLKKQGSQLLAQQQRFNAPMNSSIATAATSMDAAAGGGEGVGGDGKLLVEATDNSFVLLSGEAKIAMHQLFMDR